MRKTLMAILILSIIANALLISFLLAKTPPTPPQDPDYVAEALTYPYLSPRIFISNQNDFLINFVDLRTSINTYVDKDPADNIGFFFEYLPSGASIGANSNTAYVLASLLKVPLAMAIFKQVEENKMSLSQMLTVKEEDLNSDFGNLYKKGAGTQISVQDALEVMLEESDNTAKSVLFQTLPEGAIEDIFNYLDIPKERSSSDGELAVITPKNYSSILRSLYLSTYLTHASSNKIIQILTQSTATDKIASGVPESIKVAHKIGVFDPNDPKKSIYTDCGIVYLPKRPYVLCIMTRTSEDHARVVMHDLSAMVYNYVSAANLPQK